MTKVQALLSRKSQFSEAAGKQMENDTIYFQGTPSGAPLPHETLTPHC